MTAPKFSNWSDVHKAEDDARDVITDGLGNVFPVRCPKCGQRTMMRLAIGKVGCIRCDRPVK